MIKQHWLTFLGLLAIVVGVAGACVVFFISAELSWLGWIICISFCLIGLVLAIVDACMQEIALTQNKHNFDQEMDKIEQSIIEKWLS